MIRITCKNSKGIGFHNQMPSCTSSICTGIMGARTNAVYIFYADLLFKKLKIIIVAIITPSPSEPNI